MESSGNTVSSLLLFPFLVVTSKKNLFSSVYCLQSKIEDRIDPTKGEDSIVASKDEDIISALPDEILLQILERLDLRTAIRAGTVATRWRHLPHQLSHLLITVLDVSKAGYTTDKTMEGYTDAMRRLLSPRTCKCNQNVNRLQLCFYIMDPCPKLAIQFGMS